MTAQARFQLVANTLMAAAFIGAFYFTTAKNIEGRTVRNNVRSIFPNLTLPELSPAVQSQLCRNLTGFTDAIQRPDDSAVIANNNVLFAKGKDALKKVLGYGGLLLALIYLTKNRRESFSFKEIAIDSAWSIGAIAAAECMFFYLVVGNATYIDQQDVINAYTQRPQQDGGVISSSKNEWQKDLDGLY